MKALPLAVALSLAVCAGARAKDWSVSLEPIVSVQTGSLGEYVYSKSLKGKREKLSELDWDMKPVVRVGGQVGALWRNLRLDARAAGFIPMRCGIMQDSDWQNIPLNSDASTKTNYSKSENSIDKGVSLSCALSYEFKIARFFSLAPIAAFEWQKRSFEARNARGWYGDAKNIGKQTGVSYNDERAIYFPKGTLGGIDFQRSDMFAWIGAAAAFSPVDRFSIALSFLVAPYTYFWAKDIHYTPGGAASYFEDVVEGFFSSFRLALALSFRANDRISLRLGAAWLVSLELDGKSYMSADGKKYLKMSDDGAAADVSCVEIEVAFKYTFSF